MTLTSRTAMAFAVSMLAVAVVWSRHETREVPAATIPLGSIPKNLGPWTCIEESANNSYGIEVQTLHRTYRDAEGTVARVSMQGTYTRLGGLRDWTVARTTEGWSVTREDEVALELDVAGDKIVVTLQELDKNTSKGFAVSWYASSCRQAPTLARAEVAAWGDRLAGRRVPWLSEYVAVSVPAQGDRAVAQARALDLARRIASALRAVAASST